MFLSAHNNFPVSIGKIWSPFKRTLKHMVNCSRALRYKCFLNQQKLTCKINTYLPPIFVFSQLDICHNADFNVISQSHVLHTHGRLPRHCKRFRIWPLRTVDDLLLGGLLNYFPALTIFSRIIDILVEPVFDKKLYNAVLHF